MSVAITAYCDDSGTHAGSLAVAVAGYLSTPERWLRFEADWQEALREFRLDYFHMTDFANGAQGYKGWPEDRKRACLERLLGLISANVISSVGTVIPVGLYDRVFSAEAKAHVGGPYGLAAAMNLATVGVRLSAMQELGHDLWVDWVFEAGTAGHGQVAKVFEYNARDPAQQAGLRLRSLRFEDKRNAAPLQAADILAYELYRQLPRQLGFDPRQPRQHNLERLAMPAHDWGYPDEGQMNVWSEVTTAAARLAVTEGWPRKRLPEDWVPGRSTPRKSGRQARAKPGQIPRSE